LSGDTRMPLSLIDGGPCQMVIGTTSSVIAFKFASNGCRWWKKKKSWNCGREREGKQPPVKEEHQNTTNTPTATSNELASAPAHRNSPSKGR
jgi:hypothetical protein